MAEALKEIIKRYLLLIILLIGIPTIAFWSLFFTSEIPFLTYVINSMAGCFTIIFLVWVEASKKIKTKVIGILIGAISIFLSMFVVYYIFNWISQTVYNFTLTPSHMAEAGFSFIFGICVALSFRLIIFKGNKKDWRETMKNLNKKSIYQTIGWILVIIGFLFIFLGFITINPGEGFPISIKLHDYSNIFFTFGLGLLSIGVAVISIVISIESGKIAEESKNIAEISKDISDKSKKIMDTIGDAEIKQCVINMESLRKEYFYGLQTYLHTPFANGTPINLSHLQQINIFTTWLELENIRKAIIYKEYMDDDQQLKFFRLHRTLTECVLEISQNPNQIPIVSNESVNQLLTGITELYENFNETSNFHREYYDVLNGFIGIIRPNESFINYINRKKQELSQFNEHEIFDFQIIDALQIR